MRIVPEACKTKDPPSWPELNTEDIDHWLEAARHCNYRADKLAVDRVTRNKETK